MNNRLKTSTGAFARQQASRLLRQLTLQIARTVRSAGDDEVHDVRVAIRRFQAVLKALGPCFPGRETAKIKVTLKRIMGLAGEVRNRDIGVELLVKACGPAAAPLVIRFEAERVAAAKDLTDSLKFWVRTKTFARWRAVLNAPLKPGGKADKFGAGPIGLTAVRMMPPLADKHFKHGREAADHKTTHHELHRFRIATKKFRYTLDLFAPVYGDSVNDLIQDLKDIQTLLGDINDYATVRSMVRQSIRRMVRQSASRVLPRQDSDQNDSRGVSAAIEEKQREKTAEFRAHWTASFTGAKVRQWKEILQQGGPKR